MSNPFRLVATAALFLAISLGAWAQKPTPPPPDYFPLGKGYVWDYKSVTDAGKESTFAIKVLDCDANGVWQVAIETPWQTIHEYYTKPAGWVLDHKQVYVKNDMVGEFKPVKQYLQNPLKAGAKWSWSGTGMMDVAIEEANSVAGPETVVVPAGKFSAMKVTTDVVQGGQKVKKVYWYANHVGMVKSMTDSGSVKSTTELVKYKFK